MPQDTVFLDCGHCYLDKKSGQWVALSITRIIGRFASKDDAVNAVRQEHLMNSQSSQMKSNEVLPCDGTPLLPCDDKEDKEEDEER